MHVMFYVIFNNNVFCNDDVTEWSSHTHSITTCAAHTAQLKTL